jgi:hypothetical protein
MTLMEARTVETPSEVEARHMTVVTGDRLCVKCGYNLIGQLVVREEHYDMLIVRCPECATVTGVQEYPLLGRWANRWGALLAVLWFLFLIGMWAGTSSAIFGMGMGTMFEAVDPYADYIENLRRQTDGQQQTQTIQVGGRTITTTSSLTSFRPWWAAQDKDAVLASAGGWAAVINWWALLIWIPAALIAFTVGWFWAVALIQLRRRWLLVWGLAVMGMAIAWGLIPLMVMAVEQPHWRDEAAAQQIGAPIFLLSMAAAVPPLVLGLVFGRPMTRAFVRALLPPRLRGSLSLLWTTDDLAPPRVAAGRS